MTGLNYISKIGWLFGLVLLQVLILNNIHIANCATPFLYVYMLLKFETATSRNALMWWAFFLGLAVDVFSDTPGMNAASAVLLAFLRPTFLNLYLSRDITDSMVPSIKTMGTVPFMKYAVTCLLVHHTMLFILEFFSLVNIWMLLLRIGASVILTLICVMALEGMTKK